MESLSINKTQNDKVKVLCTDCKRSTNHLVLSSADIIGHQELGEHDSVSWNSHYQIIQCQGCETISFRKASSDSEDIEYISDNEWESVVHEKLFPQRSKSTLAIKDFLNAPSNIRRIYREVIDCYNNESFTLCGAGLRAIIDGLCADNGINDGPVEITKADGSVKIERRKNLEGQIAGLHEKGLLTKQHSAALHEHRFMGNKAVHELEQPSTIELELAIEIIEHTLENIYELSEKVKELKRRTKHRQKT